MVMVTMPWLKKRPFQLLRSITTFSGIQPTSIPHIGNYLGALKHWKSLQDLSDNKNDTSIYCIVDLHAIINIKDANHLRSNKAETLRTLLAIGIDPKKSILFFQSDVTHHTELCWILSSLASFGYLKRMTSFKSKAAEQSPTLGLFAYPVLQAADILLYRATCVPVGDDQLQHLEFARELAIKFNKTYGQYFDLPYCPKSEFTNTSRIMSLRDPSKKMSKSDPDHRSRISLTESNESIKQKIQAAVSDSYQGVSYDIKNRPAVANMLHILYACTQNKYKSISDMMNDRFSSSSQVTDLKHQVVQGLIDELSPIREKFEVISSYKDQYIQDIRLEGKQKAKLIAMETMDEIRTHIGLS